MPYDQGCYDLAVSFLSDCDVADKVTDGNRDALAQEIQDTIETFVGELERKLAKDAHQTP